MTRLGSLGVWMFRHRILAYLLARTGYSCYRYSLEHR